MVLIYLKVLYLQFFKESLEYTPYCMINCHREKRSTLFWDVVIFYYPIKKLGQYKGKVTNIHLQLLF